MAKKVFISFRASDGMQTKEKMAAELGKMDYFIDKSETVDRSNMSEPVIQQYVYDKLRDSSITIVLLTPQAIEYERDHSGKINDWLYDELRYSLQDRDNNRTNGVIAVYTEEAKTYLLEDRGDIVIAKDINNLVRKNMFNIKGQYKTQKYDYDSYVSLISLTNFLSNPKKYFDIAEEKRQETNKYDLVKSIS